MLKYIALVLMLFGLEFSCFSQEVPRRIELVDDIIISPAAAYAASGNLHVLLRDYELALEDFRRAHLCLDHGAENNFMADFMILFGQSIVYDNLGQKEKCEEALSSLILLVTQLEEIEDVEEDGDDEDEDDNALENDLFDLMHRMAMLAPSEDVRQILMSLIKNEENGA